jgi:signal transduction histidine kinase
MTTRVVLTDDSGRVISTARDLWPWLGRPEPAAGELIHLADITRSLAPEMIMRPMPMTDGTIAYVISIEDDERARENRLLRETLDAVDGSIVVFDSDLRFRLANKGYHQLHAHLLPDSQLIGRHFAEVLRMSIAAGVYADRRAMTDTDAYVAERVQAVSSREDRVVNHRLLPSERWSQLRVKWTESDNRVTLRIDITQLKRLEQDLLRSQRMKTVGRISGGVAHHFNNLMTVMLVNLEMLLDEPGLPGRAAELARLVMAAVEKGARLTDQLVAFAQRGIPRDCTLDPGRFIDQVSDLLRGALGEGVTLVLACDARPMWVRIDPGQFETALTNLVLNARDAIAARSANPDLPTGEVRITTRPAPGPGPGMISITVADNGEGMTEDVIEEAFEPFFTTRDMALASGLGLSQVHGFVSSLGGSARITSRPGHGTEVELLIALKDPDRA